MLSEAHLELKAGERVLIVGEQGAGKTLLFRALVGLWPWGSGRIARPPARRSSSCRRAPMSLPARCAPRSLIRPRPADDRAAVAKALADVGLERFQPLLDQVDRWDRLMNDDEKQRLAFARILLQTPQWV